LILVLKELNGYHFVLIAALCSKQTVTLVFWLCAGNDRLDVISLGGGHARLCGILRRGTWIHTLDDHSGAILSRTTAQCHGHCGAGQLDGQFRS